MARFSVMGKRAFFEGEDWRISESGFSEQAQLFALFAARVAGRDFPSLYNFESWGKSPVEFFLRASVRWAEGGIFFRRIPRSEEKYGEQVTAGFESIGHGVDIGIAQRRVDGTKAGVLPDQIVGATVGGRQGH